MDARLANSWLNIHHGIALAGPEWFVLAGGGGSLDRLESGIFQATAVVNIFLRSPRSCERMVSSFVRPALKQSRLAPTALVYLYLTALPMFLFVLRGLLSGPTYISRILTSLLEYNVKGLCLGDAGSSELFNCRFPHFVVLERSLVEVWSAFLLASRLCNAQSFEIHSVENLRQCEASCLCAWCTLTRSPCVWHYDPWFRKVRRRSWNDLSAPGWHGGWLTEQSQCRCR